MAYKDTGTTVLQAEGKNPDMKHWHRERKGNATNFSDTGAEEKNFSLARMRTRRPLKNNVIMCTE